MKKIKQFVFYGETVRNTGNKKCFPEDLSFWEENLIQHYGPVSHLGIQGEPGVVFYLNNGIDPITIGATGIYEINFENLGQITAIRFDMDTLKEKYDSSVSALHRLLVDVVYKGVE